MTFDQTTVMAVGLGALALAGAGFALVPQSNSGAAAKRARSLSDRKSSKNNRKVVDVAAARRKHTVDQLKALEQNQKQNKRSLASIGSQIEQAGLKISVQLFWIVSLVFGVLTGAGLVVVGAPPLAAGAAALAAGFGFPRWVLGFLVKGRRKKFLNQFADSIDVIVRGVRSGLPLNECLKIIARESPDPVRQEFVLFLDSLSVGLPIEQAAERMYKRMPLPEVNFFNIVLLIQQRAGGNLSEALSNLTGVLRSRKLLKEKVKALSAEAVTSAGIIGSMPFVFMLLVYATSPKYITLLFTTSTGHLFLLIGGVLMGMGIFIIRSMIEFKP